MWRTLVKSLCVSTMMVLCGKKGLILFDEALMAIWATMHQVVFMKDACLSNLMGLKAKEQIRRDRLYLIYSYCKLFNSKNMFYHSSLSALATNRTCFTQPDLMSCAFLLYVLSSHAQERSKEWPSTIMLAKYISGHRMATTRQQHRRQHEL